MHYHQPQGLLLQFYQAIVASLTPYSNLWNPVARIKFFTSRSISVQFLSWQRKLWPLTGIIHIYLRSLDQWFQNISFFNYCEHEKEYKEPLAVRDGNLSCTLKVQKKKKKNRNKTKITIINTAMPFNIFGR